MTAATDGVPVGASAPPGHRAVPGTASIPAGPPPGTAAPAGLPRGVERHGIDIIPPEERTSVPSDYAWIWSSAQFSFGTVVLGALPVIFGLSWWASATAIAFGCCVGTLLIAFQVRFGLRTGTNDSVASGAHFGVRGRLIGNVITLVVGVGFFAITVWTGGTAIMLAADRLLGLPTGRTTLAATMPVVAIAVILVAVYGHRVMVATYKITAVVGAVVLAALVLVTAPSFDPGYAGGGYLLDTLPRTWLLGAAVAASVPMSYSTFQGDYSRYMRGPDRAVITWSGLGLFLSCFVSLTVGAYVTTLFTDREIPWLQGLTEVVPGWFAVVVILFGLVGSFPQGALCMYAAGLSAQSIFWRRSRAAVTALVSVFAVALLYLGTIVFDATDSMAAFVTILLTFVAPWTAVMAVGFRLRRGRYDAADLGTFATPWRRGRYWFHHGLNPRALVAFGVGVLLGLLFTSTSLFVGPLATMVGGLDLSYAVPFVVSGALYHLLCRLWPERDATLPAGPTSGPASELTTGSASRLHPASTEGI